MDGVCWLLLFISFGSCIIGLCVSIFLWFLIICVQLKVCGVNCWIVGMVMQLIELDGGLWLCVVGSWQWILGVGVCGGMVLVKN